jgi:RecA-family ATPase
VNLSSKQGESAQKTDGELSPLDWEVLERSPPEPAEFRVLGWLPSRTTTLLSANGGVGKSNLALQLAVALAAGQQWMGLDVMPSRVLVVSAEDEARTVHFRVANICADVGVSLSALSDRMIVYDMAQQDSVMWGEHGMTPRMQWLADTVERHRAQVVIIDNSSDVFAANENDRAAVRGFMRALNTIASGVGCAVLLLAHVDKASVRMGAGLDTDSTFSGSTAWNNSARSRWAMVRDGEAIALRHEKCNLGPRQDELRLEFDANAKVFRRFGNGPASAAAVVVRNAHRAAILKLLSGAERADQKLSMNAAANNNAYRVLRSEPDFPRVERSEFFSLLFALQRDGLVEETEYKNDRKTFKRLVLTESGRLRAASGSGAPAMWKGTSDA